MTSRIAVREPVMNSTQQDPGSSFWYATIPIVDLATGFVSEVRVYALHPELALELREEVMANMVRLDASPTTRLTRSIRS